MPLGAFRAAANGSIVAIWRFLLLFVGESLFECLVMMFIFIGQLDVRRKERPSVVALVQLGAAFIFSAS